MCRLIVPHQFICNLLYKFLKANRKGKPPPLYEKSKSVTSETHVSSELQKRLQKRQILNGEGKNICEMCKYTHFSTC